MLWSLVTVSVTGFLLGFRFRAPALIAATGVIAVASTAAAMLDGVFDGNDLLFILLLLVTFQCGYLVGLFIGATWRRTGIHKQ